MPVGGETFIVGPYTATWAGTALGIFEGDAGLPVMEHQIMTEDIANTSAYGKALVDAVYLGNAINFQMVCLEYKAGTIAAAFPQNATKGRLGTIGVLQYASQAGALVLTAVAGTPASATPATLTSSKTILAPGFSVRLSYGPTLRKVPLRFRAILYDLGGSVPGFFSET